MAGKTFAESVQDMVSAFHTATGKEPDTLWVHPDTRVTIDGFPNPVPVAAVATVRSQTSGRDMEVRTDPAVPSGQVVGTIGHTEMPDLSEVQEPTDASR